MVSADVIGLIVLGTIALGTALYYVFTGNGSGPPPPPHRPGNRPPPPSPSFTSPPPSPPPKAVGKNNSRSFNKANSTRNNDLHIGKAPNDRQLKEKPPIKLHECEACDKVAQVRFLPCGHVVFCLTHAQTYIDMGDDPRCPANECNNLILNSEEIV